jgi:acyl-CoA thioesterase
MSLTNALALQPLDTGRSRGTFTDDWGQGRAAYGGLVAAWGVEALRTLVPADRDLRTLTGTFVGPLEPGSFDVSALILRSGRAVTMGEARITQADRTLAVFQVAYGADRPTRLETPPLPMPAVPPPDGLPELPYLEGIVPQFTRHFAYRWATGGFPFTGGKEARLGGWFRLREPVPLDSAGVIAILDAWPAPILPLSDRPIPASSITWLANVIVPPPPGGWPGDAWWYYQAENVASRAGYADFEARLWTASGQLVATSRQLLAEFSA